ncbi:MAG: nucleoside hydrolase [Candidatus Aminicenantes bacterium]|nr:nucleoside hydrolase [Candidatus Aminicenantes bacterium]
MQKKFNFFTFILCLLLFQSVTLQLNAHSYRVPLIIDTDMALDDIRALILLFNQDMADTRLMVTSDGAVSPKTGRRSLEKLLILMGTAFPGNARSTTGQPAYNKKFLQAPGSSPVVQPGRELQKKSPPWRAWSEKIFAAAGPDASPEAKYLPPAAEVIAAVLSEAESPCVYLCLGPLTNLADALELNAAIKNKISQVIYYGVSPASAQVDWNTRRDLLSARKVFASGLTIKALSNPAIKNLEFNTGFFTRIKALNTPAAALTVKLHRHAAIEKLLVQGHFRIWDEIAVIYLNRPDLFRFTRKGANVYEVEHYQAAEIYKVYLKLLGHAADSHLMEREVVVLNTFPEVPSSFKPDVAPFVNKIIAAHGMEEWKACVLTNELHRHLGIYSLIGAKMGLRAREILAAPLDSLKVISFAGNEPPLSCLNDGLQVSTGASLGRGTIKIAGSGFIQPAAEFVYRDQKLRLHVKKEIIEKIKADIRAAIKKYGNLTPAYFAHIRKLSIEYWHELDRSKIFDCIEQ